MSSDSFESLEKSYAFYENRLKSPQRKKRVKQPKAFKKSPQKVQNPKIKIVGVGGYGCVTVPAIPCSINDYFYDPDIISKVTDKESASVEMNQAAKLIQIDTLISGIAGTKTARYKYGIYALNSCLFPVGNPYHVQAFRNATGKPCDIGTVDGSLNWIIHMERADGDVDILRSVSLNTKVWIQKLENVLDGLLNMHKNKIYHFDMKPANMLFVGDKFAPTSIKISDFGETCSNTSREFKDSSAFNTIWFNFPPAAKILGEYFIKGKSINKNSISRHAIALKKYGKKYIECNYRRKPQELEEDIENFLKQDKKLEDLAQSVDIFGFSLALFYIIDREPLEPKVWNLIEQFCERASGVSLSGPEAKIYYQAIVKNL